MTLNFLFLIVYGEKAILADLVVGALAAEECSSENWVLIADATFHCRVYCHPLSLFRVLMDLEVGVCTSLGVLNFTSYFLIPFNVLVKALFTQIIALTVHALKSVSPDLLSFAAVTRDKLMNHGFGDIVLQREKVFKEFFLQFCSHKELFLFFKALIARVELWFRLAFVAATTLLNFLIAVVAFEL